MSMNIFRLAGDMSHVFSIIILLLRLQVAKNANGVSLKTQELFLIVFCTRYLDLFIRYISLYNSVMKILYIGSTAAIVHMIRYREPYRSTYDKNQDSFRLEFALAPCFVLALITNLIRGFGIVELLWTFSIYLEAVAILPQLIVLQRYSVVENLTGHYIFFLGAYRGLYILNWIYRAYTEKHYHHDLVVYACGFVQTALYADFFYYYMQSKYHGGTFSLPTSAGGFK
ncbi:er lumen protein retaining receptor [Nannochloropsis oceanica]